MATQMLVGSTTGTVAKVNLLPPEIGENRRTRKVKAGLAAGVAASVALVAVGFVMESSKVGGAESDLAAARREGTRLSTEEKKLQGVRDTYALVDARKALLGRATAAKVKYSTFLTDLSLSMPANVWLTNVSFEARLPALGAVGPRGIARPAANAPVQPGIGTVTFSGVAFDHDDVAEWLESLAKQHGYANAYFTSSAETFIGARKVYEFESSVVLTDQALASAKKPARS
jgi:Tfp pilus assembly protein PilN